MNIVANRIITPDGTVLQSFNRHDFKCHVDTLTKEHYFVDGGLDYIRTSKNVVPAKFDCVYDTDDHGVIRKKFAWGTYGKDGTSPLHFVYLKDMETSHIEAILSTQKHIPFYIKKIFVRELNFRNER